MRGHFTNPVTQPPVRDGAEPDLPTVSGSAAIQCGGHWADCPNAVRTLDGPWPVMRCVLTGEHPDDCRTVAASCTHIHKRLVQTTVTPLKRVRR